MKYSTRMKIAAVQLIRTKGINEAAKITKVSTTTLYKWNNDASILRQAGLLQVPEEFMQAHSPTATVDVLLRALELLHDEEIYLLTALRKELDHEATLRLSNHIDSINFSLPAK